MTTGRVSSQADIGVPPAGTETGVHEADSEPEQQEMRNGRCCVPFFGTLAGLVQAAVAALRLAASACSAA